MGLYRRNIKSCVFGCLTITVQLVNAPLMLQAQDLNDFCVSATCKNTALDVSAALVCDIDKANKYEYLQVTEGNVITIDNGYILVLKK